MKQFVYAFILGILLCSNLLGQPDRMQRPPQERIESYKKVRLAESLKLDESQSIKFFARYNKHREAMKNIEKERSQLLEKLEQEIKSGSSDAEFDQTFSALFDLEKKVSEARHNFMGELKEIFSPKQIAEYLIFERNFARELRDVARDAQQERMRRHQ